MTLRTSVVLAGLLLVTPATALAANGGFRDVSTAPPMYLLNYYLPAYTFVNFSTTNLSPGSDTVLQVFDTNSGVGLGGNDDCYSDGTRNSCTDVYSSVARTITVVVHAWNEYLGGSASLVVTPAGGTPYTYGPFDFGVHFESIGAMAAGGDIFTTRKQKQASDTVMVAFGDPFNIANAIAFDDDGGTGLMSKVHLPLPTAGMVAVGTYNTSYSWPPEYRAGYRLLWDEDVHTNDADQDGLGASLEAALGTSSSTADTDGDGVKDGYDTDKDGIYDGLEVMGYDYLNGSNAIELPTWGADPNKPDVFVEVDWWPGYQISGVQADRVPTAFYGPTSGGAQPAASERVAVHLDIGVDNPAAAGDPSLLRWGNWGGARMVAWGTDCSNDGHTAPGRTMFQLAYTTNTTSGNSGGSACATATSGDGRAIAHELGHHFGLGHGGIPLTGEWNDKVNYPSIMNYTYNYQSDYFDAGAFRGISMNPSAMSETSWKGSNTTVNMTLLGAATGYLISGNKVDWNQDGIFQSNFVRARIDPKGHSAMFREWSETDSPPQGGLGANRADPTLAWYRTPAGNRLYVFYREALKDKLSDPGALKYRYTTDVESSCNTGVAPQNLKIPKCATFSAENTVPNQRNAIGAPSVVEFMDGSARRLFITYPESNTRWNYQILSVDSSGGESFTTPTGDTSSGPILSGGMTSIYNVNAHLVDIYFVHNNLLKRSTYDVVNRRISERNITQKWQSTGADIQTRAGVGLTWGYLKGYTTAYLFAAIPSNATPIGNAVLARLTTTANTWEAVSTSTMLTDIKPGLAYQSMPDSSGRFTLFGRTHTGSATDRDNQPSVRWTEGNDKSTSAKSQRLSTWYGAYSHMPEDAAAAGAATLVFDSALDTSIRGALSKGDSSVSSVWFEGLFDGMINATFRDQNDYNLMKKNLRCPFGQQPVKTCTALDTAGNCTNWQ